MERIKNGFKQIRLKDLFSPIIFLIVLIPSLVFKLYNKITGRKFWLLCEDKCTARDNGYYFYRYVRKNHPDDFCFYAIDKKSKAYERVKPLGNIVQFGSLRHWIYYLAADLNISSQKSGNPSPIFFYLLHVKFRLFNNRVFLQHGITKDDSKWLYYDQTRFKYFICGTRREHEYVLEKFGYKPKNLLLTGFPRWDTLQNKSTKGKSILIMPTWRNWLGKDTNKLFKTKDFQNTDFFKHWNGLLNNKKLINYVEKNDITVYFYPHIHMQKFLSSFQSRSKNIKILSTDRDIQNYFNRCNLMVTDYSSVAFDFTYMNKPIIYYQFDLERYRKNQLQQGYFNYESNGFGRVIRTEKALVDQIITICRDDFIDRKKYATRRNKFFAPNDHRNCERVYRELS